jgi:hypothetical protein
MAMVAIAVRNLVNMAVVVTVAGAVLLCLVVAENGLERLFPARLTAQSRLSLCNEDRASGDQRDAEPVRS